MVYLRQYAVYIKVFFDSMEIMFASHQKNKQAYFIVSSVERSVVPPIDEVYSRQNYSSAALPSMPKLRQSINRSTMWLQKHRHFQSGSQKVTHLHSLIRIGQSVTAKCHTPHERISSTRSTFTAENGFSLLACVLQQQSSPMPCLFDVLQPNFPSLTMSAPKTTFVCIDRSYGLCIVYTCQSDTLPGI